MNPTSSQTTAITPEMTMEAIEIAFPSARRALFQRYHVGGCSSCAYQPGDTLAQVCRDHNILDVNEVVAHLERSQEIDERIQVEVEDVSAWLDASEEFTFVDVRPAEEQALARIAAAEQLDFANAEPYMSLPKDRKIVFTCKTGDRSLDVAAYFIGHGFQRVFSMRGGLDAWRERIDASLPVY